LTVTFTDTDEELQTKMTNFDNHMIAQRQKRSQKAAELQDDEENMEAVRKRHHTAVLEHGTLQGEANVIAHPFELTFQRADQSPSTDAHPKSLESRGDHSSNLHQARYQRI
jgi:hypothetical protein